MSKKAIKKNNGITIQKNIPHEGRDARGRKRKYPYPEMEVGDSFYVEGRGSSGISSAARSWSLRNAGGKKKFSIAREKNGFRLWRVE